MKLAIPDLISNSYFAAIAAVELGMFRNEGLDVELELVVPVENALKALRDGTLEFLGCSSHLVVGGFPEWRGAKLLCAQSQGMYWFLVMRADIDVTPGDLSVLKGKRIGAAYWIGMTLHRLLGEAGLDAKRDNIDIAPIPGAHGAGMSFGVMAAQALEDGRIDGFWANGMGAEIALRRGIGKMVLDVRRQPGAPDYTMASIVASDQLIQFRPGVAAGAVKAIAEAHKALKADVTLAHQIGKRLFPAYEAELIADIVRRDLPYYDTRIDRDSITRMIDFSRKAGILEREPMYEEIVAMQFAPLWTPVS
jgi:ABC-type nitrate/sulfonate/bicarbonate transport system substrate-binding protein